jgi:hypothetical protein
VGADDPMGDAVGTGKSYWIAGMIFFGVVASLTLPLSAMMLVRSEKLMMKADAILQENKKLKEAPKIKKEQDDE